MDNTQVSPATSTELYFGIVTPLGADWKLVSDALERALKLFGYRVEPVHVSKLFLPRYEGQHEDDRKEHYIKLGNEICQTNGTDEAVAHLAIDEIRKQRKEAVDRGEPGLLRRAFLLGTLKRPAEVRLLRELYGPWFFLAAAQDTVDHREEYLRSQIRDSHSTWNEDQLKTRVAELIALDRHQEAEMFGQDVLHTFPKADLFVDLNREDKNEIYSQVERFIKVLFGESIVPTDEENGMAAAYLASLRSTSRRRRVGAALMTHEAEGQGSIVAMGANEVAHAGGGHPPNPLAAQEAHAGIDYSKSRIKSIAADFLQRLRDQGHLSSSLTERTSNDDGVDQTIADLFHGPGMPRSRDFAGPMGEAELAKLMEFHHEVHAEISAILDAARRGVSTQDLDLYTTTYPCHLCGKEIVASGIQEVVYIEPYPKSAVQAMYEDSITTDRGPDASKITFRWFVGISPGRFTELLQVERLSLREQDEATRTTRLPNVGRGLSQSLSLLDREQAIVNRKGV